MSYDLYFKSANPIPVTALKHHFETRPNNDVTVDMVDYDNPETGVHFQWWYGEPEPGEDAADPLSGAQATLSVNFNRPTPFVREAAHEAAALAEAFDMQMIDPQADGNARPFDADTFVSGYIASAQSVTKGLLDRVKADRPPTLCRRILTEVWSWNYGRNANEAQLTDDLFIPKIMLLQGDKGVETALTWADGVPMCCPRVETILCLRRETAPTTGFFRKQTQDLIEPIPFDAFLGDFGDFFAHSDRFGGTWACQSTDREALEHRLTRRATTHALPVDLWKAGSGGILPFHAVLDAEYFA